MVPGLAVFEKDVSKFGGRERSETSLALSLIVPGACNCQLWPFVPNPTALHNPLSFSRGKGGGGVRRSGTVGKKNTKPGLLPALTCLLSGLEPPPLGAGPTSPKVSRCSKVGEIIQTDDINDGAHHTGVILGEDTGDGVRPGTL